MHYIFKERMVPTLIKLIHMHAHHLMNEYFAKSKREPYFAL